MGPMWSLAALARNAQGGHDVTSEVLGQLGAIAPRHASPEYISTRWVQQVMSWKNDSADDNEVAEIARASGLSTEDVELLLDRVDVFAIECAARRGLGTSPLLTEGLVEFATALERRYEFVLADYNRFEALVRADAQPSDATWRNLELDALASSVAACAFRSGNHLGVPAEALRFVADRFRDHLCEAESTLQGLIAS